MGVTLSTHSTLAPISLASTLIGFISFAFTLLTFLRVFWDNLTTLYAAPTEVHDYLTNLRTELYEERNSLRALRRHHLKRCRDQGRSGTGGKEEGLAARAWKGPELDEMAVRTMQDSVRHLIRRFKQVERPFLENGSNYTDPPTSAKRQRRQSGNMSPYYGDSAWDYEKGGGNGRRMAAAAFASEEEREGEVVYSSAPQYCNITLAKRFVWLRYRSEALGLMQSLSRVQTRRIARQVGEVVVALHEYGNVFEEIRGDVGDVSGRLNRVVGIRRVD